MTPPREVPHKDSYYMGEAFNILAKSKDPSTQVGARLVSVDGAPISTGFNGPHRLIDDNDVDWTRPNKYRFVIHAEINCIKYARGNTKGATLYVTAPPCPPCMAEIVEAGISRVVYFSPPKGRDGSSMTKNEADWLMTRKIAKRGDVTLEEFSGDLTWMISHLENLKNLGIFDK